MSESARRRRDVVVAGHRLDPITAAEHLNDPDATVRSSALRALRRCGALPTVILDTAMSDSDPIVRRTAAELAAFDPESALEALLVDVDPTVTEVAAWALGEWGHLAGASVPALCEVATAHADSLCRESATAALGAIGDARGLPAVLRALEDKATVRRRAAIALAAFDGPVVDGALEGCLSDRDWQVRQVAEDLLDRRSGG